MRLPRPQPGLVIRYSYLWAREAEAGREEGVKDRPCAVVLVVRDEDGGERVQVLPITHRMPEDPRDGLEIPLPVRLRLGLDNERAWVVVTELNEFIWPGPDLCLLPGRGPQSAVYGFLPPRLFRAVRDRLAERRRRAVKRTE